MNGPADADSLFPRTTVRGGRSPTVETVVVIVGFFLVQFPLTLVGLAPLFALGPHVVVAPWTLVTSVYAHAGVGHLLGNLLFLALFGLLVERVTTRFRFHAFFLLTGALAGLAEVVVGGLVALEPRSVLGASGAIFALMGYAVASNGLSDRLLDLLDRSTDAGWAVTLALVVLAVVVGVLLSGPGTAVVGHVAGLALGLLAGRVRLLHRSRAGGRDTTGTVRVD